MRRPSRSMSAMALLCAILLIAFIGRAQDSSDGSAVPGLKVINGYKVLTLVGSPEDMGRQHGRLLKTEVRRMVADLVLAERSSSYRGVSAYDRLIMGAKVMDQYIPIPFRRELRALADEADVDYFDLVAAQLHGDVDRATPSFYTSTRPTSSTYCSSYAAFGPATLDGSCIIGRNFDFWDNGIMDYGAVIIDFHPDNGLRHVSMTWAGIINGWTLMNERGIVAANNTAPGRKDSLEGISTCFMLRKIAQYAPTVEAGVRIIEEGPRSCGTNILVAGGRTPNAAVVEFDHENVAVRWAERGRVTADNSFYALYKTGWQEDTHSATTSPPPGDPHDLGAYGANPYSPRSSSASSYSSPYSSTYKSSRYRLLEEAIDKYYGRIDETMNFAGLEGVPMGSINLHSAMLFPNRLAFAVSMGDPPAYRNPYRRFRMTASDIVSDETDGRGPLMAWSEEEEREQQRGAEVGRGAR